MPRWSFENKVTFGNVLTIITLIVGLIVGYATLSQSVASSAEAVKAIPVIASRVTTIEIGNQVAGAFQADTKQALKDQEAILSQILQTQAAILARLDEKDRVGR